MFSSKNKKGLNPSTILSLDDMKVLFHTPLHDKNKHGIEKMCSALGLELEFWLILLSGFLVRASLAVRSDTRILSSISCIFHKLDNGSKNITNKKVAQW